MNSVFDFFFEQLKFKVMKTVRKMSWFILALLLLTGCQKEVGTASFTVRMTDAPVDYDEVNVEIELVQVHYAGVGSGSGWTDLQTNAGIYDLLLLQNGVSTALVLGDTVPVGHMTQMRLILGDNNTVVVDGVTLPLDLSSQSRTGLKINLDADVDPGDEIEIHFDFDAEQSIVIEGNGTYKLKPVLKLETIVYN